MKMNLFDKIPLTWKSYRISCLNFLIEHTIIYDNKVLANSDCKGFTRRIRSYDQDVINGRIQIHRMISELMNMHDVSELTFMDFSVFKPLFLFQKLIIFETIMIISWQLVLLTNS